MIEHWPWWGGGLALAGVALGNWALTGRLLAVSGRFSKLVDVARYGREEVEEEPLPDEDALAAMLRAATLAEFGPDALAPAEPEAPAAAGAATAEAAGSGSPVAESGSAQPWWFHLVFLAALAAGGAASAGLAGAFQPSFALRGETYARLFGAGWPSLWPLVLGGFLVGFGTRMAGGCTSGHGLCGVSRFQRGSLLATCSFFGAGILTSLLLGRLA